MSQDRTDSYSRLYTEAEERAAKPHTMQELSPLYFALASIQVRYTNWRLIGTGGMKEVFQVKDEQIEREVALARPKAGIPPERYDAFLREAHLTARLEHPNIIKLFGMGIDQEKRPFFTMEFKRGLSLRKIISLLRKDDCPQDYPLERRLLIFLKICEAVSYAHSRHVLHLDLKPDNIQIGPFGEVQVCDWGMGEIARGDGEHHFSEALLDPDLYGGQLEPSFKGTPGYMPPEQEDPRAPKTPQNDIFALGCMLYELSTLKPLRNREKSEPEAPALAAIVNKACAKSPEDRYETAEELSRDVHLHLTGHSPEVEEAGFFREARLFYQRNSLPCLISLSSAALLLVGGLLFATQLRNSYLAKTEALVLAEEALVAAQTEKQAANLARNEAEDAYERLQQERELAANLLDLQGTNPTETTLLLIDILVLNESMTIAALENAIAEIDQSLEKDPSPHNRLYTLKAYILFLMQRFHEAEPLYAMRQGSQGDLRKLAPEFGPRIREDGLLPVADFMTLLKKIAKNRDDPPSKQDRSPFMEKMVVYDSIRRKSPSETAQVIELMLRISNEYWTTGLWDFDPETLSLRIQGHGLRTLYRPRVPIKNSAYPNLCLLRLLGLQKLTLRAPNLRSYEQLNGLSLQVLDIRGCPSASLTPLAAMPSLRKIVVTPGQFTKEQLSELSAKIAVLEIEEEPPLEQRAQPAR